MQNLFTYGTLMCTDIMLLVAGKKFRTTSAELSGYRRFSVQNEDYPGVVPCDGSMVTGIIYHDISPEAWIRLDRFEGKMYDRCQVKCRFGDGKQIQAYCYIVKQEFRPLLTLEEWNFDAFLRNGKALFKQRYEGFTALNEV